MPDMVTLKDDFTFLVSDYSGDVDAGPEGSGMFLRDTRYLSRLELFVAGKKPSLLSYTTDYNIGATFRMAANYFGSQDRDRELGAAEAVRAIGIARRRYIEHGLIESLEFTNYYPEAIDLEITLIVGADFLDMFEVRGMPRPAPGHTVSTEVRSAGAPSTNGHEASVGTTVVLRTHPVEGAGIGASHALLFTCSATPVSWSEPTGSGSTSGTSAHEVALNYLLHLPAREPVTLHLRALPEPDAEGKETWGPGASEGIQPETSFRQRVSHAQRVFTEWQEACTRIRTSSYTFNRIMETGILDLRSLMQQEPQGLVVTAGLPWFFTLFGRDSLITSLQTLMLNPTIAVDTLHALAAYQATEVDDWRDSEPGKILHELRRGDMALAGEVPHSPYYGSIDSTLLYMMLFAETLKWTNSQTLFDEMWGSVRKALDWAWHWGDMDGDGYIEFKARSSRGIRHQGWKDSDESLGGALGPRPEPPIALVEVQGYYYAALMGVAGALRRYGGAVAEQAEEGLASRLEEQAAALKEQFNRDFWWEEEGFYVHALDGKKKQVRDVTSNVGHCLWTGIVDACRAARVVARIMRPDMRSGWGIRTISANDPTYNPMSYHNGSVWPHDNAIMVAGLRRYGFRVEMLQVATEVLDAAATFTGYRLPELYCGFGRGTGVEQESAPAAYPVSCSPQAWAAGSPLMILQALLDIDADAGELRAGGAAILLEGVERVELRGMSVGGTSRDLDLEVGLHGADGFGHDVMATDSRTPQTAGKV